MLLQYGPAYTGPTWGVSGTAHKLLREAIRSALREFEPAYAPFRRESAPQGG
jgi:hypothetical protein